MDWLRKSLQSKGERTEYPEKILADQTFLHATAKCSLPGGIPCIGRGALVARYILAAD
jgi:hypothetical protein